GADRLEAVVLCKRGQHLPITSAANQINAIGTTSSMIQVKTETGKEFRISQYTEDFKTDPLDTIHNMRVQDKRGENVFVIPGREGSAITLTVGEPLQLGREGPSGEIVKEIVALTGRRAAS
ncbi:hypothetical protein OAO01_04760, partial [Oligoflexia bacterium]|nr:hypothetical protein [Oligoflexia bacterium]